MAVLPVPAKIYFSDFSFELASYTLIRNSEIVATIQGLANKDEDGKHIGFLIGPDIKIGDTLTSTNDESYVVKKIGYDTYLGKTEMIKAYY